MGTASLSPGVHRHTRHSQTKGDCTQRAEENLSGEPPGQQNKTCLTAPNSRGGGFFVEAQGLFVEVAFLFRFGECSGRNNERAIWGVETMGLRLILDFLFTPCSHQASTRTQSCGLAARDNVKVKGGIFFADQGPATPDLPLRSVLVRSVTEESLVSI